MRRSAALSALRGGACIASRDRGRLRDLRDKELVGDDGDPRHGVQLLEELEAVGELQLKVDTVADHFQKDVQEPPGLALEHHRDELG